MARTGAKRPAPPYVTVLEREPEYLRAIGTLAVEIVNVEVMLAYLLAAITRLSVKIADAMYFAPQAMGARIPIVAGVVRECLGNHPEYLRKANRCLTDARTAYNKRNDIMHHAWGISEDNGRITRRRPPFSEDAPPRHVPITEIKDTIYSTRLLIGRIHALALKIGNDETYSPWPDTPSAQPPHATNNDHP
jgi:hypothetical protein